MEENASRSEYTEQEMQKLKRIAHMETWVMRLKDLLSDVIHSTENLVRKKQSRSYSEIAVD